MQNFFQLVKEIVWKFRFAISVFVIQYSEQDILQECLKPSLLYSISIELLTPKNSFRICAAHKVISYKSCGELFLLVQCPMQEHSCICQITRGFATCDMTYMYALLPLEKLCKDCSHPKKLHLQCHFCLFYWFKLTATK